MSSIWGNKLRLSIFGESHSEAIGCCLDGFPSGIKINFEELYSFMKRRSSLGSSLDTPRIEKDFPNIICGVVNGVSCGTPISCIIQNQNTRSMDYDNLKNLPRPSHADYTGSVKYNGYNDARGGGHFSGRLTAPLVFAGGLCKQYLMDRGVRIYSRVYSIKSVVDDCIDYDNINEEIFLEATKKPFSVISAEKQAQMEEVICNAKSMGDSVGGVCECVVFGLGAGFGAPIFDGIESVLSSIIFSIPGVKGVEFGKGFGITSLFGSQANDSFYLDSNEVRTKTNNSGGINGGISNGMPIVIRVAFRPTASISKCQETLNLSSKKQESLSIVGRHDPSIVKRANVCVESAVCLGIADLII